MSQRLASSEGFQEYLRKSTSAIPGVAYNHPSVILDDAQPLAAQAEEENKKEKRANLFAAWAFADKLDILIMVIAFLLAAGLGICLPLNITFISDGFGKSDMINNDFTSLQDAVTKIFILGAVTFVAALISNWLLELTAERQVLAAKSMYFRSVARQEVGFFDTVDIGTLASDVEMSCVKLREGIGMKSGLIFKSISTFIGGYVIALTKDWRLALVLTTAVPLIAISFAFVMRFVGKATERSKQAYKEAGSVVEEAIPAARTVAAFGLEDQFVNKFEVKNHKSLLADLKGSITKSISVGLIFLIIFCSYALAWWYGGRIMRSRVTKEGVNGLAYSGTVMGTIFSVLVSAFSLAMLSPSLTALSAAAKSVASIKALSVRESLIDPENLEGRTDSLLGDKIQGAIEFRDVRFAYPSRPERDIYSSVSFKINPGDQVALVGPSGAGKSTVIQLLQRYYDPQGGDILVDGVSTRDYQLKWFRSNIGMVQQEPRLFCTTILENIACGKEGATREEIENAARSANAHDFIMGLTDGYDTVVGTGGGLLSGGQKQRIAIARAILRNPSILILDEATSALDNQSERIVQEALDKLLQTQKRTTIIIAHRLTTIRNANKIIVIDNVQGKGSVVIEEGTHDELIKIQNGVYAALVEAQSAGINTDAAPAMMPPPPRPQNLLQQMSKQPSKAMSKAGSREMSRIEEAVKPDKKKKKKASRELWLMQLQHWKPWVLSVLCTMVNAGSQPGNSLLVAEFMKTFLQWEGPLSASADNASRIYSKARFLAIIYVIFAVCVGLTQATASYTADWSGFTLTAELRKSTFTNMIHQDMEFFDNPIYNTGFLSSVLSADCEASKVITGQNFNLLLMNMFSLVIAMIIAFVSSWRLALVTCAIYICVVPMFFLQAQLIKSTAPQAGSTEEMESPAFVMNELITNLKMVSAYGLQDKFKNDYIKALTAMYQKGKRNAMVVGVSTSVTESILYFASGGSYKMAIYLLNHNLVDFPMMMRANLAVQFAGGGAAQTSSFTNDAKRATAACENIFAILKRKPKMDSRDTGGFEPQIQGKVDVEHVKFRYPGRPDVPVLRDVCFNVKEGETIALVGESGSGKSTITQFLLRYYDVGASEHFVQLVADQNNANELIAEMTGAGGAKHLEDAHDMFAGLVKVEGHDIQSINLRYLRSHIGLVGQEPVLFDQTVAENIRNGKPDATDEEVIRAAKLANAHDFIMELPEKYETNVGKGGGLLSGGQKQRVAIARALVRSPKILILDEATSALDPESEKIVQAALDSLMATEKRTTLVIAHRLSTIRNADKIVVFKPEIGVGSKIVEVGNHDELMQIPEGIYRNLVNISQRVQTS